VQRHLPRIHIRRDKKGAAPRGWFEKWVSPTSSGMLMPRQSAIESLIQLTLDQAKRRRRPTDLKDIHNELIELHREFKDLLPELADRGIATKPIDYLFDTLVVSAYLLGSASPNPKTDRTAKAVMARQNMRKEQPALPPWKEYVINRLRENKFFMK
jgi:hypothetical protein